MELIEKKVIDYINEVDALTPAPGGGSVASLVGTLGVCLAKMLAHFSTNKKKFKEASVKEQEKFVLAFKELDYYKDMLIKGIDDDAISYNAVTAAYKKGDEEEIQKALKYSALVAYEMQEASYKSLYFCEKLINLGNKNLRRAIECFFKTLVITSILGVIGWILVIGVSIYVVLKRS